MKDTKQKTGKESTKKFNSTLLFMNYNLQMTKFLLESSQQFCFYLIILTMHFLQKTNLHSLQIHRSGH